MPQAELDLPVGLGEPGLYHDTERHGFFAVLQKQRGGVRQDCYRLSQMPEVLRLLPRERDSWLSQAECTIPVFISGCRAGGGFTPSTGSRARSCTCCR